MFEGTVPYEFATLVVCVLIFDQWERRRPARKVDKRSTLGLDVFSIVVVAIFGSLWKPMVRAVFDFVGAGTAAAKLGALHGLPSAAKILLGIVLADFVLYWVHVWMHAIPWMWRSHKYHHSIENMYWLAGSRTSLTHLLLFAIPQVLIARYLLALTPVESAIAVSFGVVVNIWVHLNLAVSLGPLEKWIITPSFHRLHHARDILPSKNLGFLFTFWDRMFGTYQDPRTIPDDYPLGLPEPEKAPVGRMVAGV